MKKLILSFLILSVLAAALFQIDFQKKSYSGCAFCNEELVDSQCFYRGEKALALITYKPAVPGHVLIVPERHVERFEDLTAEEIAEIGAVIKKVDQVMRSEFGHSDYFLMQKNGRGAGQTVPHVHFHYVPAARFLAIKYLLSPWFKPLTAEEIQILKTRFSGSF
jgi:diadenosine tetraphosphate (Ap4A) HIT family hydrolase